MKCLYGQTHYGYGVSGCIYCERDILKTLVREIGAAANGLTGYSECIYDCSLFPPYEEAEKEVLEVLSRPEVKAIMEGRGSDPLQVTECTSLCKAACPHSVFSPHHCSLPQGHAGPHLWTKKK